MSGKNLYELKCQRCGGQLEQNGEIYRCKSCGKTFKEQVVTDVTEQLRAVLNEQKQEAVANLRQQLWAEMHEDNINSERVRNLARDLKKYLPEDYFANFCEVANSEVENNAKQINAYLYDTPKSALEDYAEVVLDFMIKSLKTENITALAQFIERAFKGKDGEKGEKREKYNKYTTWLEDEADKIDKGIYDLDLPRDVFLAYSSADMDKVLELCEYLESNDISCFMALRNLRHGRDALHNYDQALKTAIDYCKTVVFVSSTHSRSRSCDAFTKELPYIRQKDLEAAPARFRHAYDKLPAEYMMPRVEYFIEDYCGNVAEEKVREFFHGLEWCRSKEAVAKRILDYLTAVPEPVEEETEEDIPTVEIPVKENKNVKYCKKCGAKNRLTAKFCSKCEGTEFAATYDEYLASKIKYCALCGEKCDSEANACDNCGGKFFVPTKKAYEDLNAQDAEDKRQQQIREQQEKEAERKRQEDAERKRRDEELKQEREKERLRKLREEQERLRRQEEERQKKLREEEERKRKEEEDRLRKLREEQERLRREEEERKHKEEEERQRKAILNIGDYKDIGGGYITFGAYPQSKKEGNVKIGEIFDKERGYYLGNDNCPYAEYYGNYFKVEPIKWKVLSRERSKVFVVADSILDVCQYSDGSENCIVYANSRIRSWLNNVFYNKAFREAQKNKIVTTKVDNSVSSTGDSVNRYACGYTDDKIFLLSHKEAKQYHIGIGDSARKKGTDYARFQGTYYAKAYDKLDGDLWQRDYPSWWLRSPHHAYECFGYCAQQVDYEGYINVCRARLNSNGVLPALNISENDFDLVDHILVKYYGAGGDVVIPSNITSISKFAFKECSLLKKLVIPKSVVKIEEGTFDSCPDINLIFEDKDFGDKYFEAERKRRYINENFDIQNGVIVKYKGNGGDVEIPDGVKKIEKGAFSGCTSLTSIVIPNSVKHIGNNVFDSCKILTSITIPDSVISIGEFAFINCSSLKELVIPKSVSNIGEGAFDNCPDINLIFEDKDFGDKYLEAEQKRRFVNENFDIQNDVLVKYKGNGGDVEIPNNVKTIGKEAFSVCTSLKSIVIPKSVKFIGEKAFYNCSSLKSIDIPNSVTSIGEKALSFCDSLTSITLSKSVKSVGAEAFSNCTSLKSIDIPNSVKSIGEKAFYNCDSLTSVNIGNGVTSIGIKAFCGCFSLKGVYIEDLAAWCKIGFNNCMQNPLYYAGNLYLNGKLVTELLVPQGVTSIARNEFYGCRSIENVVLPDSVVAIGSGAFNNCTALKSIIIPNSIISIYADIFNGCSNLQAIYCKNKKPLIGLPKGWDKGWLGDCKAQIVWNYKGV